MNLAKYLIIFICIQIPRVFSRLVDDFQIHSNTHTHTQRYGKRFIYPKLFVTFKFVSA